jgi:hypothetical protein
MQDVPLGLVIPGHQNSEAARQDFKRLLDLIREDQLQGAILFEPSANHDVATRGRRHFRGKGLIRGAALGFLVGLVPLLGSTLLGAAAGGAISEFARLRIRKE